MDVLVYCDGSVTGGGWGKKTGPKEPVRCWFGWIAQKEDGTIIKTFSGAMGEIVNGSGNVAEYSAVRHALLWLKGNGYDDARIIIHSDSQLIIHQMSGKWRANDERMRAMRDKTREAATAFPAVEYRWIPREQNKEADALSKALQN